MSEGNLLIRVDSELAGPSGVRTVLERCWDPEHRSLSADRWWDECQHRGGLIARGELTPSFGLEANVGSAVHAAAAADLLGSPEPVETLLDRYMAESGNAYGSREVDAAMVKARSLFTLWESAVRPRWLAVGIYAVEWELHLDIGGATYHVHPDVVLSDGSVIDLKTSEKRLTAGRVALDQQLTTYGYAIWRAFGHLPPSVAIDGLIYTNPPPDIRAAFPAAEKPWWDRQSGARSPEQYAAFEAAVKRREAARKFARATGVYQTQAVNGPHWVCTRCEVRTTCPAWSGTEWPDGGGQ